MGRYNGKINGRILNNQHDKYVRLGVYEKLYETILESYKKKNTIKVLSIDSTFISNKNGKEKLGRNVYILQK